VRAEGPRRFGSYTAYKDSGVEWLGEIPAHWAALALKRLVDPARPITYGIVQCGPDYPDGIRYIRPVDMKDEAGVEAEALQRTAPEIAAAYTRSTVHRGDIVVSIGPSFGKVMIVPDELDGANLTQGTARVAPGRDVVSRFLFWALRSESSRMAWDSFCSGATFRALTLEILESCELALPPTPDEQRAIAAFLDRETAQVDALVAEKERLIGLLREKRTALITRAVTRGLNPHAHMRDSGIEWLGEIPAHWHVRPLKYFLRAPLAYGVLKPDKYLGEDGVRLIRILDVQSGHVSEDALELISPDQSEEFRRTLVRAGDLVVSVVGTIGRAFVVPRSLEGANLSRALARVQLKPALGARFLEYGLRASPFESFVELVPTGTAQRVLNLGDLAEYRLASPPPSEQSAIIAFLDREMAGIDALVARVCDAIERLKEFRTALISAAATGKIDVRGEVA
jgi:type I restriction enzyme S subunit